MTYDRLKMAGTPDVIKKGAVVIAGAILADVGKLLEEECGVPAEVCHIIAAHAHEGDLVKRTTEAYLVHHVDFMTFLPFKNRHI